MSDPAYPPLSPYLMVKRGPEALDWYARAFDAKVIERYDMEDGRLGHATLSLNGGSLMLSDEFPEMGGEVDVAPKSVTLHLQVDDADEWWNRAIVAGGVPVHPLADQFWGDRYGVLKDPFGHCWSVGSPIKG